MSEEEKEFRVIKEFPEYEISKDGVARRIKDKFLLKIQNRENKPNCASYYIFKGKERTIKRLLRDAFGEIPDGRCLDFIWFKNYIVTRKGEVYSTKTYKYLKQSLCEKTGYKVVTLCNDDLRINESVHRLVAISFLPNPENKPQVNHIDGVKVNNNVENLEWCTVSENTIHAWENGLKPKILSTRSYSEDLIHSVCKMICNNKTNREIYEKYDIKPSVVAMIRHKDIYNEITKDYNFNVKHSSRRKISIDKIKSICELIQEGYSGCRIAKELEVSEATVHKIKYRKIHQSISKDYIW